MSLSEIWSQSVPKTVNPPPPPPAYMAILKIKIQLLLLPHKMSTNFTIDHMAEFLKLQLSPTT